MHQTEIIKVIKGLESVFNDTDDDNWTYDDILYFEKSLGSLLKQALAINIGNSNN